MSLGAGGSPGWAHHNYLNCQVHGKDLCGGWNIEARCCFCELRDHDLLSGDVFLKKAMVPLACSTAASIPGVVLAFPLQQTQTKPFQHLESRCAEQAELAEHPNCIGKTNAVVCCMI